MAKFLVAIGLGAAALFLAVFGLRRGEEGASLGPSKTGTREQSATESGSGKEELGRGQSASQAAHSTSPSGDAVSAALARVEKRLLESPPGVRPVPFTHVLQREKALRILVRAYPQAAFERYLSLARNRDAGDEERALAVRALRIVAESEGLGSKVRDALITLARGPDGTTAREAILALADTWASEELRALYSEMALGPNREARYAAVEGLADYARSQSLDVLTAVERAQAVSDEDLRHPLRIARERLAVLLAPDFDSQLISIIQNLNEDSEEASLWTIKIAKVQGRTNLLQALRNRIDRQVASDQQLAKESGYGDPDRFKQAYIGGLDAGTGHDEALLALRALGGSLKESEALRLRSFGLCLEDYEKEARRLDLVH